MLEIVGDFVRGIIVSPYIIITTDSVLQHGNVIAHHSFVSLKSCIAVKNSRIKSAPTTGCQACWVNLNIICIPVFLYDLLFVLNSLSLLLFI